MGLNDNSKHSILTITITDKAPTVYVELDFSRFNIVIVIDCTCLERKFPPEVARGGN